MEMSLLNVKPSGGKLLSSRSLWWLPMWEPGGTGELRPIRPKRASRCIGSMGQTVWAIPSRHPSTGPGKLRLREKARPDSHRQLPSLKDVPSPRKLLNDLHPSAATQAASKSWSFCRISDQLLLSQQLQCQTGRLCGQLLLGLPGSP